MLMSKGSLGIFVSNGLVGSLMAAGLVLLLLPLLLQFRRLQAPPKEQR
jgi:TctA family transporter